MKSVKSLSFYEQVGIVAPGATVLFGLFFISPDIHALFTHDGMSLGEFGLFATVSYVAGHLLAAVGNLIEKGYWALFGGMPSSWVIKPGEKLLSDPQIEKLNRMLKSRARLDVPPVREMPVGRWQHIFMQLTADVRAHKADGRAEIFNGNYGLNRGLAAALLVLAATNCWLAPDQSRITIGTLVLAGAALYRMHRFGVHYARTMLREYLQLPESPAAERTAANANPRRTAKPKPEAKSEGGNA